MSRELYIRSSLALIMSELVPPLLRDAVLADTTFGTALGLATDGVVALSPSDKSFKRSTLLAAVRRASTPTATEIKLLDEAGAPWTVRLDRSVQPPTAAIQAGEQTMHVLHLGVVSEMPEDRAAVVEAEFQRVNLPSSARESWKSIISDRSLDDCEVALFANDINNTPVSIADAISAMVGQDRVPIEFLVPRSQEYYERLVGRWSGQRDIREYAEQVLPAFLEDLLAWKQNAGLGLSLLLCSHPLIIDGLGAAAVSKETFDQVARWAVRNGDVMSRCALLELALLRKDFLEGAEQVAEDIIASLLVPEGKDDGQFEVLSAAFIFVYGQLSHLKILADKPTFWRRMAAFAQAAMISRHMAPLGDGLAEFADTLRQSRYAQFALQVYADLRLGPLWQSQFALLPQLRNEIVGRVILRGQWLEQAGKAGGLGNRLLGDGPGSLKSTIDTFFIHTAGPLEHNLSPTLPLGEENTRIITAGLAEPKPVTRSFAPLVNSAFIFQQSLELADMAALALQRAQYRFDAETGQTVVVALVGLATCASITRSTALSEAVLTSIRYYRRFSPLELSITDAIRIGLTACASREELSEWAELVGNLMSDFAFQSLSKDEGAGLKSYIVEFCDLIPELCASCGPALSSAEAIAA